MTGRQETERRRRVERRTHVLFTDWHWAWRGRRRATRRSAEAAEAGTDLYEAPIVLLAVGILVLSALDATFTLMLLGSGHAREVNPFMRALIEYDVQTFVNLKVALTAAGLMFMVPCADLRLLQIIRVRFVMVTILFFYAALVSYEVATLAQI